MVLNRNVPLAEWQEKFDYFMFEMSDVLEALKSDVAAARRPELLPLDDSWEALDRLESYYALVLDGEIAGDLDPDILATRIGRFVGETLRKRVGGKWSFCRKSRDINYGKPCLTAIPGLPKSYCFLPLVVVAGYRRGRRLGWLRKETEINDIEKLRASFARFLDEKEARLGALSSYIESLARQELLPLDFSLESLERLEKLLVLALDEEVALPSTGLEGLSDQISIYMGEFYRQSCGGDWELADDPKYVDFGWPHVRSQGYFPPRTIVENFCIRRKPGLLRSATEAAMNRTMS